MQHTLNKQLWDVRGNAFVIAAVFLGFIFVVGFVGNGIVIAVITALRRRGERTSVQLFVLHLAISDLIVCMLGIPLTILTNFHYPAEYHSRDHGLCKLSRWMQHFGPVLSVTLLTAISIDRYLTFVRQEFVCSQRSWYFKPFWLMFFAWVYSTIESLPVVYTVDFVSLNITKRTMRYYCTTTQGKTLSGKIVLGASLLLGFIIPTVTMITSYYRVIRVVWTRETRLSSAVAPESNATVTNRKLLERSRKRVLRALLTVVICFVVCWLPFAVYHVILEQHLREPPNPIDAVRLITYSMGLANSMCNPFIYYFNFAGKSLRTMKRRFMEIMGRRNNRISSQIGTGREIHATTIGRNMVQMAWYANDMDRSIHNSLNNNVAELAFTSEIRAPPDSAMEAKF